MKSKPRLASASTESLGEAGRVHEGIEEDVMEGRVHRGTVAYGREPLQVFDTDVFKPLIEGFGNGIGTVFAHYLALLKLDGII
jgi:hypothetical protein